MATPSPIPALGNADENFSWPLTNLPAGTYYWSVQAVDHAWAGSAFAAEKTFTLAAPGITVQPASQIIFFGNTLNLSVTATGSTLTYQWQFNGTNLPGATGSTLAVTNMNAALAGNYQVVINNVFGTLVSSNAVVTVPEVVSWGYSGATNVPLPLVNVELIAAGNYGSWALKGDATSAAWGAGAFNPSGAGSGNLVAASMSMSGDFSLGLRADGQVLFWGYNIFGEGNVPADLTNCICVAAGEFHALAVKADGTVKAWGRNDSGQCNVPAGLNNVVAVAAGESHSLALKADGTVVGWGADAYGEIAQMTNLQVGQSGTYSLSASNLLGAVISSNATLNVVMPPPCASSPAGLVSWWPGEGNANDSISTNNGALMGNITFTNGMVGQAFRLDGVNSYVQIPDSASLKPTNVTVEAWVWLDPATVNPGTESIIFKRNTWTYLFEGYSLAKEQINSTTAKFSFVIARNGNQVITRSTTLAQRGVWYHVAGTYDGTTATIWVNGVPEISSYAGFALDYGAKPVCIGQTGEAAPYVDMFAGIIDEPSIYSRALSSNEMAAIYSAGVSGKCVPVYPPFITSQPVNQAVVTNQNAAFTVIAGGTQPLSYQWYFNNTPLTNNAHYAGVTSTNLAVFSAQLADAGSYSVIVTNYLGSVTSSIANLLVVSNPPAITTQPQSQSVNVGTNLTFTTAVTGDAPLNFQWYFNGVPLVNTSHILGSTSNNLTVVNAQTNDMGNYFMIVTNLVGMATSSVATVTILSPPVATVQPTGRSVPPGWPTTFSASFTGGTPMTYQWQLNGADIPGATNTTYAIAAVGTNDLGFYHLVASNSYNVTASADAKLTFGNVAVWGRNLSGESQTPPDLTNAFAVAGSYGASFAARTDGSLISWGAGTATNISVGATNVVALSSSAGTVVLRSDGSIVGWNFIPAAGGNYPVPNASNIVAVAAGNNFGFALRAEGTLVAWGGSPYTNYPAGLNHVTAVACGISHSLALKSDGTVVSWGDVKTASLNVPFNLTNVVGIAAGYAHSLALKGDGTVTAWGSGTGTNLPATLTNVAAIFAGNYFGGQSVSLAIRSNGTVVVWGDSSFSEINPPSALANLNSVTGAGAANHVLTVLNSGSPLIIRPPVGLTTFVGRDVTLRGAAVGAAPLSYQWLSNGTSIPGATNASLIFSNIQTASAGSYQLVASNAVGIAVSLPAVLTVVSNNTLTLLSAPAAVTNAYQGGRVVLGAAVQGNGPLQYQWFFSTTNVGYTPVSGATNDLLVLEPALASQSGNYYLAASNQFAGVTSSPVNVKILFARAWGFSAITNPPFNVTNAIAIAVGSYSSGHYFGLGADGKLKSWAGYSPIYYGETNVATLSNSFVTAIAAGYMDSLALKSDGTIYAWGYSQYGETNAPAGLANITAIACGDYHDLALKADGTVVGWGQNTYAQITNAAATNVIAIAAGSQHSLALRADGTVTAWGYNGYGQTVVPPTATNAIAIAAGSQHNLALRANGTVIGWGNNGNGQLNFPAGVSNIVAIAAGGNHSTLLRADGTILMFGIVSQTLAANTVPADLANVVAIVGGGDHDFGLLGNRAPTFTVQPWNRGIYRGTASVVLAGKVSGVQPMSYQWRFNGANISAATNDVLTLNNLQIGQSGSYQLIASNAYGVTASKAAKVTVTVPLGEALDVTNLTWISSGSSLWFGQTNVTHDGVDAAQSGSIGNSQETILQTTIATNWPGRYTFWWKVSSEAYYDTLEFRINGISQTNISGEVDWQPVSIAMPAGTNILQWRYSKDTSNSGGQDAAWVDQFVYVPDPPVITLQPTPANQTVNLGTNVNYFVRANGGTISYQWLQNGSNVVGGNSSSLNLNNVSRAQNGNYFVVVANSGGGVTSSVVNLKVLVPQLLGAPVMLPGGAFQLSSTDANGGLLTPADLTNLQAQASTNLTDWTTLSNALTLTNGVLMLSDPAATNMTSRYYRIIEN